jgi:hypothetical protein
VAATEPEHIIRKAEFDLAINSLDERISEVAAILDSLSLDELFGKAVDNLAAVIG